MNVFMRLSFMVLGSWFISMLVFDSEVVLVTCYVFE